MFELYFVSTGIPTQACRVRFDDFIEQAIGTTQYFRFYVEFIRGYAAENRQQ